MLSERRDNARLQSDFYRDQFRKMLRLLIVCIGIMFILIAAIIYFILFQPAPDFYANTTEGKILKMPAEGSVTNNE